MCLQFHLSAEKVAINRNMGKATTTRVNWYKAQNNCDQLLRLLVKLPHIVTNYRPSFLALKVELI